MSELNWTAQLKNYIRGASRIVFFTGAGISTESGIPDFRSADGLYSDPANRNVFEISAFRTNPEDFYLFAGRFLQVLDKAEPNAAHQTIAALQKSRKVSVVTQNVDGLHQLAGSNPVFCVHGDFTRSICTSCGAMVPTGQLRETIDRGEVPFHSCGGIFKPTVTFFGESLPCDQWEGGVAAIREAELLVVVGSSLVVYPAAQLPSYRPDNCRLVIINREPTPLDEQADLVLRESAADALGRII